MEFSYSKLANNPLRKASQAVKLREEARQAEFSLAINRGAVPRWPDDRFVQCDKLALHHGKRCVLWDDEGSGFCLWLNWDWAANCPATIDPTDERSSEPGWYQNLAPLFTAPLLDTTVGEANLAAWIDANTMRCHKNLLERLHTVRRRSTEGADAFSCWELEDVYQQVLDAEAFEQ